MPRQPAGPPPQLELTRFQVQDELNIMYANAVGEFHYEYCQAFHLTVSHELERTAMDAKEGGELAVDLTLGSGVYWQFGEVNSKPAYRQERVDHNNIVFFLWFFEHIAEGGLYISEYMWCDLQESKLMQREGHIPLAWIGTMGLPLSHDAKVHMPFNAKKPRVGLTLTSYLGPPADVLEFPFFGPPAPVLGPMADAEVLSPIDDDDDDKGKGQGKGTN